ncbi:hypothetical protein Tco_0425016 [Tanacetum coccineum]
MKPKKGLWSPDDDQKLRDYVMNYGHGFIEIESYRIRELSKQSVIEAESYRIKELSKQRVIEAESYRSRELSKQRVTEVESYQSRELAEQRVNRSRELAEQRFIRVESYQIASYQSRELAELFEADERTFKDVLSRNMQNLESQLNKETLHEKDSNSGLKWNEIKLQNQECTVQKALDASSGDNDCSKIVSDNGNVQDLESQSNTSGDESSRSRNECNDKSTSGDDTDISPTYDTEPMVEVPYTSEHNVFAVDTQHSEQSESISNTCVVETGDSNVIPDSPDMCDNDIQNDQNVVECDDERVTLANLIANLKLDVEDNKTIQKQLKKANASLTQELTECKSILAETSRTLGESNSIRDSCLVALQNKQTELEKYIAFNDRIVDYDKLERKLNETLGLLAQNDIDIKEGLKLKAYEISVVQEKHDELVK